MKEMCTEFWQGSFSERTAWMDEMGGYC